MRWRKVAYKNPSQRQNQGQKADKDKSNGQTDLCRQMQISKGKTKQVAKQKMKDVTNVQSFSATQR